MSTDVPIQYLTVDEPSKNDKVLSKLKPYSLVINATGLGKDRPGSPLSNEALFPHNSLVWELNYRGDLLFMHQALSQKETQSLYVEDGWIYFIHGWTQVISEVFQIQLSNEQFTEIERISSEFNQSKLTFIEGLQKIPGYREFIEKPGNQFSMRISWNDHHSLENFMETDLYKFFHGAIITLGITNEIKVLSNVT